MAPHSFRLARRRGGAHGKVSKKFESEIRDRRQRLSSLVKFGLDLPFVSFAERLDDDHLDANITPALALTIAELDAVDQFVVLADSVGLHIPAARLESRVQGYLFRMRSAHLDSVLNERDEWFSPEVDDTFGLAQHHGVPTRMLDFTRNPLVAAFFAVRDARDDDVAFWAINTDALAHQNRIDTLSCKRYENTFLHAQDGIFLWDRRATAAFLKVGSWPTLDSTLREFERQSGIDCIKKFTLTATEAPRLLRLLWRERVSIAHLMPTYDNIAQALPIYWKLCEELPEDSNTRPNSP